MSKKWSNLLEQAIIGKLVEAMLDEGFRIEFCDQDGGGLFMYAAPDAGQKPEGGWEYWVVLVLGNGPDVISDYSVNLESIIKPVNDFAVNWQ